MRSPRHLLLVLSLIALPALAIAGCGGGGGGDSTATTEKTETTPSLTKAELIKQGDGICAEVNAAVGSISGSTANSSTQVGQIANLYTGMVASLERLGMPQEDAPEYSKFIQSAEELAKAEGEAKLASEREDTAALEEAQSASALALAEFQSQAGVFGFEECSKEPSAPTVAPSTSGPSEEVEEGGVEPEAEFVEPEVEEVAPEIEEVAPETGGAGGEIEEVAPEAGGEEESSGGGGVGPG